MGWTQVGPLWPALQAKIDGLIGQQSQLMSTAATVDELTVSGFIPGYISGAANPTTMYQYLSGATNLHTFWVAPYPCRVVSGSLLREYGDIALGTSTNYATGLLLRVRNAAYAAMVRRQTDGSAWPARTDWNFDNATWDESVRTLQKGDALMVGVAASGTAQVRYPLTVTCRVQPL